MKNVTSLNSAAISPSTSSDLGLQSLGVELEDKTSLTGKTASLALLTLSVRVKVVWPFGFEVVRLYLLSKDVKLLLPSSDEDTSVYKTKHKINHSDKHAFPEAYKAVFLDSILHGIAIVS